MRHCPQLTSLIIGCILLFTVGCSTYVFEEETPETEEEKDTENKEESEGDEGSEGNNNIISSDTIFTTAELPVDESLWGDQFFVWKVDSIDTNTLRATLITLNEFYNKAADAIADMETLSIDGIGQWQFFTEDEAKAFRNQYSGSNLSDLNTWLLEAGFSPFKHDSSLGQRYLCAEGTKTFALYSNTISKAGQKKKYYYRGVKTVVVVAASQR